MIFSQTWEKVLSGEKTQTRRLRRGPYKVGHVYAVQPGRGKRAVGHIKIKRIWREGIYRIAPEDIAAEGLPPPPSLVAKMCVGDEQQRYRNAALAHFIGEFLRLNGLFPNWGGSVWAFEFELVPYE